MDLRKLLAFESSYPEDTQSYPLTVSSSGFQVFLNPCLVSGNVHGPNLIHI